MKILFNGYPEMIPSGGRQTRFGPQIFTEELVSYLHRMGHEYIGVILHSKDKYAGYLETVRTDHKGGTWLEVTTQLNVKKIFHSQTTRIDHLTSLPIKLLTEMVVQESPDIILLNGYSLQNWYLLKAAHAAGIPIVVSHHGLWFKEISHLAHADSKIAVALTRRMEKDITKYADHEIFLNEHSLREYRKNLVKVADERVSIIPIPYNRLYANPESGKKFNFSKNSKKVNIGFVGRWDPVKNPLALYRIAVEAKRQGKDWNFFAVTKMKDVSSLNRHQAKFKRNFIVLPHLIPEQLQKFYKAMDLLILPSHFETAGLVVAEAALQWRGTIISPNVGWNDEYKQFGMDEWVDDFKDAQAVVARIEKLLNAKPTKKFINHLSRQHHPEKVVRQYLAVLRSVLKSQT